MIRTIFLVVVTLILIRIFLPELAQLILALASNVSNVFADATANFSSTLAHP